MSYSTPAPLSIVPLGDAYAAPTDSSSLDYFVQALQLVMQNSSPTGFLDAAMFARLLCVSKSLQTALEAAAVGTLSVDLTLSTSGRPARFELVPDIRGEVAKQQLAWVSKHLQQGHIRQLRLSGVSARSIRRYGTREYAIMPAMFHLWTDICSQHKACIRCNMLDNDPWSHGRDGFYTLCGVLVHVKTGSTPAAAEPQLSHTITQLTLGIEEYPLAGTQAKELWQPALKELPQLTSLQELELPLFNPPAGALAPALSSLVSLTKLYIRHPLPPEQQALPVSLKHLTVARQYSCRHAEEPSRLAPLQLTHLTRLDTLVIEEDHWRGSESVTDMFAQIPLLCEGVPAGSTLPVGLQHLVVKGVRDVQPLLTATHLKTLTITHIRSCFYFAKWHPDTAGMLPLTQLTSLTKVAITGQRPTQQQLHQHGLQEAFDALPVDLSGLDPDEPGDGEGAAQGSRAPINPAGGTAFNIDLGSLVVRGSRGCSLWTGVRAFMGMLTGRNA